MAKFKRCRQSWALGYWRGLALKRGTEKVGVRDIGNLVHLGLEGHYKEGLHPLAWAQAYWDALPPEQQERHKNTWKFASKMLEGYYSEVVEQGQDAGWTIVGVERQIEIPFGTFHGEDVVVTGKVDLEVVDEFGLPGVVDHKSVDQIGDPALFIMNQQLLNYSVLRRMESGIEIGWALHNQLKRVLRSGTAKPPYYGRTRVSYSVTQLRSHWLSMYGVLDDMVRVMQVLEAEAAKGSEPEHAALLRYCYPNPTRECSWDCDFLPVCPMLSDGSDWRGFLDSFYEPYGIVESETEEK